MSKKRTEEDREKVLVPISARVDKEIQAILGASSTPITKQNFLDSALKVFITGHKFMNVEAVESICVVRAVMILNALGYYMVHPEWLVNVSFGGSKDVTLSQSSKGLSIVRLMDAMGLDLDEKLCVAKSIIRPFLPDVTNIMINQKNDSLEFFAWFRLEHNTELLNQLIQLIIEIIENLDKNITYKVSTKEVNVQYLKVDFVKG